MGRVGGKQDPGCRRVKNSKVRMRQAQSSLTEKEKEQLEQLARLVQDLPYKGTSTSTLGTESMAESDVGLDFEALACSPVPAKKAAKKKKIAKAEAKALAIEEVCSEGSYAILQGGAGSSKKKCTPEEWKAWNLQEGWAEQPALGGENEEEATQAEHKDAEMESSNWS